jgi:hypothetical protein
MSYKAAEIIYLKKSAATGSTARDGYRGRWAR